MKESAHTLYVATEAGESIGAALCALLVEEGYSTEGGRTQIGWWRRGAPGWTVLETFPPELLIDRAMGSREPRLATLARRLGCEIVYVALHEGVDVLLVEADRKGRWGATGAGDLSRDPERRDKDDPRAGRDGSVPRFVVLEASEAMLAAAARGTGLIRAVAKLWGGAKSPTPVAPDRAASGTPIPYSMSRGGGRRVRHAKFGEGTVIDDLGGDPPKVNVRFDDGRCMLLLARFVVSC